MGLFRKNLNLAGFAQRPEADYHFRYYCYWQSIYLSFLPQIGSIIARLIKGSQQENVILTANFDHLCRPETHLYFPDMGFSQEIHTQARLSDPAAN